MPVWGKILEEITALNRPDAQDVVRRKYLKLLHEKTGRNIIIYASAYMQKKNIPEFMLVDEDMQGFMQAVYELPKTETDLILHSPGGSMEAAEGIVRYLHQQYPRLRVVIPLATYSAGTMISCAAHEIVMGKHSNLGPTDPQVFIPYLGTFEPAVLIRAQYKKIVSDASAGHV